MPASSSHAWLHQDQRRRWREGEPARVEDYLVRLPDLEDDREALLDLIYSEVILREEDGESPRLEEYLQRFPQLEAELRPLFEIHRTLEDQDLSAFAGASTTHSIPVSASVDAAEPARSPTLPGYDLLGELGRGGAGVVYKARDQRLGRIVALKMLLAGDWARPAELARFRSEAETVARLQHPGIVQIFEVGTHEGRPFFAMEYVDGPDLSSWLGGEPRPAEETARLVAALAHAVHHAHQHGVVHRDLKPANILIGGRRSAIGNRPENGDGSGPKAESRWPMGVKITDFGLAKHLGEGAGHTRTGDIMGTPSYMAPEQAAGKTAAVGPAADIYALGAICYECLTGRPPFRAESPLETLAQVLYQDPVPPSRLRGRTPRDLETICLKCLDKDPRKRYASPADLAADLERYLQGKPILARPISPLGRAVKLVRRRPVIAALTGFSAMVLFALGFLWMRHLDLERLRLAELRDEVQADLRDAEVALARSEWETAQALLARGAARTQPELALTELHDTLKRLLARTEFRARAQDIFTRFVRRRDEALFLWLQAHADRSESVPRRTMAAAARQALALVESADDNIALTEALETKRAEIAAGCYALTLILADALADEAAEPGSAAAHKRKALEQAVATLDAARKWGPATRVYHQRRAAYFRALADEEAAKKDLEAAAGMSPTTAHEFFLAGTAALRHDNLTQALKAYNSAVALQPAHFWAQLGVAVCFLRLQQWEQAKSALAVCLVVREDVVWPYLLRSLANQKLGAFADAEVDLHRAANLVADEDREAKYFLLMYRGVFQRQQDKLKEAAADFAQASGLAPAQFEPHLNLAWIYQLQGKAAEADAHFKRAVALDPPGFVLAEYHTERGREHYRAGRWPQTLEACAKALEHDRRFSPALGVKASALLKLQRFEEAARTFDEYLKTGGAPVADVFRGRGQARMRNGDFLGARDDYSQALALGADAELYLHRGWAYFFADAWQPALRDFDQAVRLNAKLADAYIGRGLSRVYLGNYRQAVRDADEALRRKLEAPEMLHNVACIFAQAIARVEADAAEPERADLRRDYSARAIRALQAALDAVPEKERTAFWRDKVRPDHALDPIRSLPGFRKLASATEK